MSPDTTLEQNKELVRRNYEQARNQREWEATEEIHAPDWVHHNPSDAEAIEELTRYMTEAFEAVPDLEFTITVIVAEDDAVAVFWTMSDTHDGGEFAGSLDHVRPRELLPHEPEHRASDVSSCHENRGRSDDDR